MSVFLRWGIFGILGVAALLYAYNASKRLAEAHAAQSPPAVSPSSDEAAAEEPDEPTESPVAAESASAPPPAEARREVAAECEEELVVAQRAIDLRKEGAPLDRVLRIQQIAWQETPERRERLVSVATRWFSYSGSFSPEALRIAVINACEQPTPAP
ncbi:MAG TPA: hypothetical protein VFO82_13685 [Steroidobacteraceae bacterium]|nr:hypothetical protein [Steroidobacteraceae bacterium]